MPAADICRFLPADDRNGGLRFLHFVYEASYKRLSQPFRNRVYRAHLAFKGSATLKIDGRSHFITPGTLFFTFPDQVFTLEGDASFTYLYLSFLGPEAAPLLERFQVSPSRAVYPGLEHLLEFWMTSIRRITDLNAAVLSESVLLYSLSYLQDQEPNNRKDADRFDKILGYIHGNYADPSLSIAKVADIFFYSKKYLSALFVKNTGVRFSEYLNQLRVRQAEHLLQQEIPVSEIAVRCGFANPGYFSKVFRKLTGLSPMEYKKQAVSTAFAEQPPEAPTL